MFGKKGYNYRLSFLKVFIVLITFLLNVETSAGTSIVHGSDINQETSTETNVDNVNSQHGTVIQSPDTTPVFEDRESGNKYQRRDGARSMSTTFGNLDPLGVLKSASRMVRKGVHVFRESLQEGVKVASMLRDDVDEGVTQILGTGKTKNADRNSEEEEEAVTVSDDVTEKSDSVSKGFPSLSELAGKQSLREGMIGGILRFMNVDSSFLGVMALNVLIYVAEMITSTILGKDSNAIPETRTIKANIMEWVVKGHNKMLDKLIKDATSASLPEKLLKTLQDKTGNSTSCVQLLVCKMSPVIWGVQKTVSKQLKGTKFEPKISSTDYRSSSSSSESPRTMTTDGDEKSGSFSEVVQDLMKSIPTKEGFTHFGDECEQRFPTCHLLKFPKKNN